jgi:signal transduction histidine kinase
MILAANDGTIMIGPDVLLHSKLTEVRDFTENGRYVVGRQDARDHVLGAQRWTVIVRQPAADAFGPAETARASVFMTVALAGLLASAAAAYAAHALTRRLARLDANAEAVLQGALTTLSVPPGKDEISRIGATLAALVSHLQKDKASLQSMNEELDARVAERTAQIAKLAEESKHAAVTRERLRLARDLHDTLAHSLMALLTQIRMVRMVRETLQSCELDAELLRAEEVATSGLTAVRGAIAQMRNFNVHDTGLGGALRDLVNQFSSRSGIPVNMETDLSATQLADDRAEVAFRIAQEALRNVERHAHAGEVRLYLRWVEQLPGRPHVRLEIIDDGQGFDTSASRAGHYGLRGMEEQAALIGAQLELESQHGRGTRIALLFTVA